MRYLAVDYGQKRTGLAVGDDQTRIASALPAVMSSAEHEVIRQVAQAAGKHDVAALVLGLPLNMDGSLGPAAQRVKSFGQQLANATGLPVRLVDERLSTAHADERMDRTGLTHAQKKARRDGLAACELLQRLWTPPSEAGAAPDAETDPDTTRE